MIRPFVQDLASRGWTDPQIANRLGVSKSYARYLRRGDEGKMEYAARGLHRRAIHQVLRARVRDTKFPIGYSGNELRSHLEAQFEPGMTWDNYGEWEIDHIRPVCSFQKQEIHLVNQLSNLRPLWGTENRKKGGKWEISEPKK
jgi:hypothetical protein